MAEAGWRLAEVARGWPVRVGGLSSAWRRTRGLLEAREVRGRLVGGERRLAADLVDVPALPVAHEQLPHSEPGHHLEQLQRRAAHLHGAALRVRGGVRVS